MKNPFDVLRIKEQELLTVKREVQALRIAARLLEGDGSAAPPGGKDELAAEGGDALSFSS